MIRGAVLAVISAFPDVDFHRKLIIIYPTLEENPKRF